MGSHILASVRYLRYISRPSNRTQSNMLEDVCEIAERRALRDK